jgi:MraZ protein
MPRGMYSTRLDEKGRLKLPAVFQRYLDSLPEKKLFVTSLDRRTAAIYPIATWRKNEELLRTLHDDASPDGTSHAVLFVAHHYGSETEMDGQGRILCNADLRRAVKLEGTELHLCTYRGHIEILPDDVYLETQRQAEAVAESSLMSLWKNGLA